ncbi:MAG: ATP-binding protein, partial [Deltaproteobacteria bacterium]|nr:ATP-binding protein [Deltaproteobacteria bacterium]
YEVIGTLGKQGGRAGDDVTTAEERVLAATAAARDAEAATGARKSPLDALAAELGLSPIGRLIFLLVAGPALWGELARLYGILANDEQRALVDEMLLVQILAGQVDRTEIARQLDPDAPLVRHGLVRAADTRMRPFAALQGDTVALRLIGDRAPQLEEIRIVERTVAFDDLLVPSATKAAIVRGLATAQQPLRIAIRGRTGSGRHTTLATLAAAANRHLGIIDVSSIVHEARTAVGPLRTALCRAHMLGLLPCIDGLEGLSAEDRVGRDLVASVLDGHPGPLAIRLPFDARPILAPGYLAIDLPALTNPQRLAAWHVLLQQHRLFVRDPEELASRYGIGPGTIHRVCARVAALPVEDPPRDLAADIEIAIRQHLETGLRATATRVERLATWSRVVLPADVQDSVLELIARIKHRRTVYDEWGYDQVLSTSRGVTALFQGSPGTGKTLVASAIASELGMDLYRVDLSRIMSKWIGETEQNLAKLFDAAEDGHAIILFDEADSLFAKRTEVRTSVDRYANLEVNYLLQRLDTFEGIAILTTNFGTSIDSAFKRRLSFRLTFPFPDEEAREALWKSHIAPNVPRLGDFNFADLARRYRLSGGYIRNAAVRAAFLAAEEQSPLTHDHLVRAIQAEFREIGKIAESGVLE